MATTIQITDDLQKVLLKKKMFSKETYEEVIWNLIEDNMELSEETKRDIEEARNEIKLGKFVTLEEAKKRLGLK
jgi:predicted transcriptional regulator